MFGFSPFSETAFSALETISVDGWNEILGDSNAWTQIDPQNVGFLVLSSGGTQYQVSFTVKGTQSYGVLSNVLNSNGTVFVPISESWQTASIGSNSWTEV